MTAIAHPLSFTQLALGLEPRRRTPEARAPQQAPGIAASAGSDAFEAAGRAIGRDYARHGLTPGADHLHPGHPVRQGWEAALAGLARGSTSPRPALRERRHVRRWLELRLAAWMHGRAFDALQVTPGLLARIDATVCPITRQRLAQEGEGPLPAGPRRGEQGDREGRGGREEREERGMREMREMLERPEERAQQEEGVVVALREEAGFVAGNLVVVSRRAARALAGDAWASLGAEAARRATDLRALVTPVPHAQSVEQPLSVLPPPRVRVLNAAHELQVLLTTLFSGGAYARRMSALGTLMPDAASRRAYATLMSTLLARRLESEWAAGREQVRQALEDAWLHPTVQRRWAELMGHLTAAQCARVVRRAMERGLAAGRARWLEPERAVEGWAA